MSNWGIEDDSNLAGDIENTGPKALREAYAALKKKDEEKDQRIAALERNLQTQQVQATLSKLGIPAAAAAQYKGDTDPDKVKEWATTMQSIFGGGTPQANTPNDSEGSAGLEPDVQARYDRLNGAGQEGTPLGNGEALAGRVADATDLKGLLAAWQGM